MRDPDVQVQTVFTAHGIGLKEIELNTPLTIVSGFQDTCAGKVSKSTVSALTSLGPSRSTTYTADQKIKPSQPG